MPNINKDDETGKIAPVLTPVILAISIIIDRGLPEYRNQMGLTNRQSIRVLHIDDESTFADTVAEFLKREDDRFTVETATSVARE